MSLLIKQINFNTDAYQQLVDLRFQELRKPLGLEWNENDFSGEVKQIHFAAYIDNKLVGVVLLAPISNEIVKLRQMAVHHDFQKSGIGSEIINYVINYSIQAGFHEIVSHVRMYAVPFYEKLGFKTFGEVFTEVTIPHIKMVRSLS